MGLDVDCTQVDDYKSPEEIIYNWASMAAALGALFLILPGIVAVIGMMKLTDVVLGRNNNVKVDSSNS